MPVRKMANTNGWPLSDELTAKVLSIFAKGMFERATESAQLVALQFTDDRVEYPLHEMRLVCKQFKKVVDHHPDLATQLFLRQDFPSTGVGNLIRWIQDHRSAVRTLVSTSGSPLTEVALAALVTASAGGTSNVGNVLLHEVSAVSLSMLTAFSSLHGCTLSRSYCERPGEEQSILSLSPLQVLPNLQSLTLCGSPFGGLGDLAHLTRLDVSGNADCGSQCLFLHTLKSLIVQVDGNLTGLGALGVSGCLNLQSLVCHGAVITAGLASHSLDTDTHVHLPASLSTLVHLTRLTFSQGSGQQPDTVSHAWVYKLTNLQEVTIGAVARNCRVSGRIGALTQLTRLTVGNGGSESTVDLHCVPWKRLRSLHTLEIRAANLCCECGLLDLLDLQCLRSLNFSGVRPVDRDSLEHCGTLLHKMGTQRPQV